MRGLEGPNPVGKAGPVSRHVPHLLFEGGVFTVGGALRSGVGLSRRNQHPCAAVGVGIQAHNLHPGVMH